MLLNFRLMLRLPGNHIVFAFSDPAGASACIGMSELSAAVYLQSSTLISNRTYHGSFNKDVQLVGSITSFKKLKADCLFTGTSHPASSAYFEVNCIKQAKEEGIKTISFVDHWINFRLRFLDEEMQVVYPDEIWLVDDRAKELAVEECLPPDKLEISGNPYHEFLKKLWKPKFNGKSYLEQLQIPTAGLTVLFAPDPLSLRNGQERAGFTEAGALRLLINTIGRLNIPIRIIIKYHPLQPVEAFAGFLEQKLPNIHFVPAADTLELLQACDIIIGFYSNILLEAEAINKKTIRFFPGNTEADLLRHKSSLPLARDEDELLAILKHCINE
jgi:hypothetical protein